MKISENTIKVLKNYASINPSIYIREGSIIRTKSPSNTILSKVKVEEQFDKDFAIYDLSRFLSTLAMFQKPDIEIHDKYINITEENRNVKYTLHNPELIVSPRNEDPKLPGNIVSEFDIKAFELSEVMKAMNVLTMKEISIVGDGKNISIRTSDNKNDGSDVYSVEIAKTDNTFKAVITSDNLKLMSNDYNITVADSGIVRFYNDTMDYYIACDTNESSFS